VGQAAELLLPDEAVEAEAADGAAAVDVEDAEEDDEPELDEVELDEVPEPDFDAGELLDDEPRLSLR
jgi:hypothetical protein